MRCNNSDAPWTCIAPSIAGVPAREIRRAFVASVDAEAQRGERVIVITARAIVATEPPAFVVRQRFSDDGSAAALARASEDLTRRLLEELAVRTSTTTIDVKTEPRGAEITLDGTPVGVSNIRLLTTPGKHVLVVTKPRYAAETREISVARGETATLGITLRATEATLDRQPPPISRPQPEQPAPARSHLVPALAVAGGVGLLAYGGVARAPCFNDKCRVLGVRCLGVECLGGPSSSVVIPVAYIRARQSRFHL